MTVQRFIVSHEGQELGPFSESEIKALLLENKLFPIDYLYDEVAQDWILINERFNLSTIAAEAMAIQSPAEDEPPPHTVVSRRIKVSSQNETKPLSGTQLPTDVPRPKDAPKPNLSKPDADHIRFENGVGEIRVKPTQAGKVQLLFRSGNQLAPENVEIFVQAGPAHHISIDCPSHCVAGDKITLTLKTYDAFNNRSGDYSGSADIHLRGEKSQVQKTQFTGGVATVTLEVTKAETVQVEVVDPSHKLQTPKATPLNIKPGKPVRLKVEGPQEVQAGEDLKLKVKAVDAYGNLVDDFKGDMELSVETKTG